MGRADTYAVGDQRAASAAVQPPVIADRRESRAAVPDRSGSLERNGVRIGWETYGEGQPAILLLPTWSIVHSRCWKLQVPYLARSHRVITFDPRGNGRSDRPRDPAAYAEDEFAADAVAVLDETGTDRAVLVGLSIGAQRGLIVADEHPGRVLGLVLVGPTIDLGVTGRSERARAETFTTDHGIDQGWARFNAHSWLRDYAGFVEFFFEQVFAEPHSTKQIEDCVRWGLETDAETLIAAEVPGLERARARDLCARLTCPVLVVHGTDDAISPYAVGVEAARLSGGQLLTFDGAGHCPQARDPVRFNIALREFIDSVSRRSSATEP